MKKNKGFTLLELLVVIAIIGILATIVMVSLQGARRRAQDASIQAQISSARAAAELYATGNDPVGSYEGAFTAGATNTSGLPDILEAIEDISGAANVQEADGATGWCLSARKVSNTAEYYCTDDTGVMTDGDEVCVVANLACE